MTGVNQIRAESKKGRSSIAVDFFKPKEFNRNSANTDGSSMPDLLIVVDGDPDIAFDAASTDKQGRRHLKFQLHPGMFI